MNQYVKEMEEALQAGPTPGPWCIRHDFRCSDGSNTVGVAAETIKGGSAAVAWPAGVSQEQELANARLIAACSPDRIRRLLDYISKLEQEVANGK